MLLSWLKNRRRRKILAEPFPPAWLATLAGSRGPLRACSAMRSARSCTARCRSACREGVGRLPRPGIDGRHARHHRRPGRDLDSRLRRFLLRQRADDSRLSRRIRRQAEQRFHRRRDRWKKTASGSARRNIAARSSCHGRRSAKTPACPATAPNLVFHEFAHQLDMLNGDFDGTPNLPTGELADRWAKIMDVEYRRLQRAEARQPAGRCSILTARPIRPSSSR